MKKHKNRRLKFFKYLAIFVLAGLAGLLGFILSVIWGFWGPLPTDDQLADIRQSEATEVLDRNGELIGKYFIFDRQQVPFEEIPEHLINALIATEDARFYEHDGIDQRSLLRVVFKSILMNDESAGGGSTISQQLIKNLYPRRSHGFLTMPVNKTREAYLATRLEKLYSKEEIITLYLNTVPFGDNTFGVESAAEKFFSAQTTELTLEESAVIVGMLKASYGYNPRVFPERALRRRNVVLEQMEKYGYLSFEEAGIAQNKPLQLSYQPFSHDRGIAPYLRAQLQQQLVAFLESYNQENNTDYNLFTSGLAIETTLDKGMQAMAEASMEQHMTELQSAFENSYGSRAPWLRNEAMIEDAMKRSSYYQKLKAKNLSESQIEDSLTQKRKMELWDWKGTKLVEATPLDSIQHYLKLLNAGMMSLEPRTGEVRAWVGGINYKYFQYDHVVQSKRQVGSTFKPIVYTAALESGISPCDYIPARTITYTNYDDWTPTNSGDIDEEKSYAVKTALAQSINTIAVKLLTETEIGAITQLAEELGIQSDIPAVPSIALGTPQLSMFELARAYTAFVNNGKTAQPFFIKSIKDKEGKLLAEFKPVIQEERVISEPTRQAMIEMMKGVIDEGTGRRLRWKYGLQNDIAGKTGTTQDNKDGWFVALTPRLITLTWVGNDDHRIGFRTTSMGQGANSALPIYGLYQQKLNQSNGFARYTGASFPPPTLDVLDKLNCDQEKSPGFLKKVFTNAEKPKLSGVKIDTATAEEKKPGLFKRIGNIFKKKKKKN